MEQVWMVMKEHFVPGCSHMIVSVHKSEAGAKEAEKKEDGHVWVDGPYQIKD